MEGVVVCTRSLLKGQFYYRTANVILKGTKKLTKVESIRYQNNVDEDDEDDFDIPETVVFDFSLRF